MKELIKEETLDVIRQMVADGQISQEVAEKYFPKLKESENKEDERIIKALIFHYQGDGCICTNEYRIDFKDIRAWLEKQGQQETEPKFKVGDIITPKDGGHEPWQIMQVDILDKKYIFKDGYVIHFSQEDNYELVEQKSTDKPEPKFKVGDWVFIEQIDNIINGPRKIKKVNDYGYVLDSIREIALPFTSEHCMRLWTIEDAKDGDVLAFDDETIVIFKDLYNTTTFHSYCHIEEGAFSVSQDDMPDWWEGKGFHPATKEQRDLLFSKMKEAGYEWDNENLVPKKIEQEWIPKTGDTIKKKETTEPLYMLCNGDNYGFFCIKLMDSDSGKYYFTSETLKGYELVERLKSTPTEKEMIEILRTEYEKGRADALVDKVEPTPIFRIGDILKRKGRGYTFMVDRIQGGYYYCDRNNGAYFPIEEQDNWELVEQNPTWSEEDEDMCYKAIAVINRLCAEGKDYVWSIKTLKKLFYWLKSLKDKVLLQPKQEWSEEDSIRWRRIINFLWYNRKGKTSDTIYEQEQDIEQDTEWLKSLKERVQPKKEWSEKDLEMLSGIELDLSMLMAKNPDCEFKKLYQEEIDWLKSLKPQKHQ